MPAGFQLALDGRWPRRADHPVRLQQVDEFSDGSRGMSDG
jgi:hypothetical protein